MFERGDKVVQVKPGLSAKYDFPVDKFPVLTVVDIKGNAIAFREQLHDGYSEAKRFKLLHAAEPVFVVMPKVEEVNLFQKITEWAEARNIIKGATVKDQLIKLMEETGELAKGVVRNDKDVIKDSIGDSIVVLTIMAAQVGLTVEECLISAYNEIKDRKGKLINGMFIKEGDLK